MNERNKSLAILTLAGIGCGNLGAIIGSFLPMRNVEALRVYERQNKPAVMREFVEGRDVLYVRMSPTEFVPLSKYLNSIADQGERAAEEIDIKRTAEWYTK